MSAELKRLLAEIRERDFWPYRDLERLGIVHDRATLRRWMKLAHDPFPEPVVMGPNSVAWRADEVRPWLARRPRGRAPQPGGVSRSCRCSQRNEGFRPEFNARPLAVQMQRQAEKQPGSRCERGPGRKELHQCFQYFSTTRRSRT